MLIPLALTSRNDLSAPVHHGTNAYTIAGDRCLINTLSAALLFPPLKKGNKVLQRGERHIDELPFFLDMSQLKQ